MAKTFTAKEVLLYLFSDCVKWTEDVDGDADSNGNPYCIVHHDIRIKDGHLQELMEMAGIDTGLSMMTTLEALDAANKADLDAKERDYREREMEHLDRTGQL